ncbi:hypothetical protein ACUXZZ_45500 (plasmid) [Streptomyces graminifolii]|uniref:hypothetical protein n=1 Tax=Streptomyces graminifolii TaxID=1266771 RepID=UPI004057CF9A
MPGTHTFLIKPARALFTQLQTPPLVEAAYYEESEDGYIHFRDAAGQKVFTVQGASVFSIERVSDTGPTAELRELMRRADVGDLQSVFGTVTDRAVDSENGVTETAYRVTVEAVQPESVDAAVPQVHVHVEGNVLTEQQIARAVDAGIQRAHRGINGLKR